MLLTDGDFLAWRCKLLECSLMDDHFNHIESGISLFHYDVSILVIMMYGRMHSRTWDPGIPPHDVLFCTTLCIDGVRKCWDPGIPYLRDLFLMTFYTRRVNKQWDPNIVDYGKLVGNTLWLVGLRKHTSSLLHGFIFATVHYGFLHDFGWTYVFLTGCHDDLHVPLMHCIGEYILHLAFLRIIWDPGIIGTWSSH